MNSKKLIAGVLTGLAAGAMISLLISSKTKRAYGKKWVRKGNDLADDLKGKFSDFIDRMEDKFQGILK